MSDKDRIEWEANEFAMSLLMPKDEFTYRVKQGHDDGFLARLFDVFPDMVRARKKALGL